MNFSQLNSPTAAAFLLFLALQSSAVAQGKTVESADEWRYTVAKGDTLIALVERLMKPSTDWRDLQRLNRLPNPQRIVPGTVVRIPVGLLRSDAAIATVSVTQGNVSVRRDTARLSAVPAGTELRPGDRIDTGPQSTLAMTFIDGSRMTITPDSKVLIESLLVYGKTGITETRVKVDAGGVESQVKPMSSAASRYVITTPVFNLGVRGTDFRARFDPTSQFAFSEVLEGRVIAGGKTSQIPVSGGFGTLAQVNTEPRPPVKLLSAPLLKGLPEKLEYVPLSLSWEPEAGASTYRAKVFQQDALDRQLLESVFAKPVARWSDLPDGSYVLQVRSIDADGLEGAATARKFVLKARPVAPFVSQPAEGAKVYGDSVIFKWSESVVAEKYHLQVASDKDFKSLLLDRKDVTGGEYKFAVEPGTYFWRIASIAKGDDHGPFGEAFSFVQRKIPESPGAADPPAIGEHEMAFSWKAREPGQTFRYQVSSDLQFATSAIDAVTSEPTAKFAKPAPGTHYLRLKSIDADGFEGPFGAAQKFVIPEPPTPWWYYLPVLLLLAL